jgi:hypothetical protein
VLEVNDDEDALVFNADYQVMLPAANQTINLTSSMTRADIQAEIDKVQKYIPYSKTVTFQFGDGTYTLNNSLNFHGFYGGGTLRIKGNTSDGTSRYTTQSVVLDFDGQDSLALYLNRIQCFTEIFNLKILFNTNTTWRYGIYVNTCFNVSAYYSYFVATSTNRGYGVHAWNRSYVQVRECYVDGMSRGLGSNYASHIFSYDNEYTGTQPIYGLVAVNGGVISKYDTTQPTGSTANELVQTGGEIR